MGLWPTPGNENTEASPPRKRGPTSVNSRFRETEAVLGDFQEQQ